MNSPIVIKNVRAYNSEEIGFSIVQDELLEVTEDVPVVVPDDVLSMILNPEKGSVAALHTIKLLTDNTKKVLITTDAGTTEVSINIDAH